MKSDDYLPPKVTDSDLYAKQLVPKGDHSRKGRPDHFRYSHACFAEDEAAALLVLDPVAVRYLGALSWLKVVGVSEVPYSGPPPGIKAPFAKPNRQMFYYDAASTRDLAKFLIEHRQKHGMLAPIPTVMSREERNIILRKLKDAQTQAEE